MTKLLCPNCMKAVSVPDEAAGTNIPCPECGKPFAVPARYNPVVATPPPPPPVEAVQAPVAVVPADRPPPPPGLVPPVYPSPAVEPDSNVPAGYTHSWALPLSPRIMAWVPPVTLAIVLLLTFFPWVVVSPGGHQVYGQGAWRALTGVPTRDIRLEGLLITELPPPPIKDRVKSDAWAIFPYLLALILSTCLAWADRLITHLDINRLPPAVRWVGTIWPSRIPVIAALATGALLLLLIQMSSGFGLERAITKAVDEKYAEAKKKAGDSASDQERVDFDVAQELAKYDLQRTTWLCLAISLNIVAVLATAIRVWLDRRGSRPIPRFVFQC